MRQRGFTLVELIVVIAVLAIIAIVATPRFANRSAFEQTGFRDQVLAVLQHARKTAVASRRHVCVAVNAGGVTLTLDPQLPDGGAAANCISPLNLPGQNNNSIATPASATLTSTQPNFSFDPLGRASSGVALDISGQPILVEQETGYVR